MKKTLFLLVITLTFAAAKAVSLPEAQTTYDQCIFTDVDLVSIDMMTVEIAPAPPQFILETESFVELERVTEATVNRHNLEVPSPPELQARLRNLTLHRHAADTHRRGPSSTTPGSNPGQTMRV